METLLPNMNILSRNCFQLVKSLVAPSVVPQHCGTIRRVTTRSPQSFSPHTLSILFPSLFTLSPWSITGLYRALPRRRFCFSLRRNPPLNSTLQKTSTLCGGHRELCVLQRKSQFSMQDYKSITSQQVFLVVVKYSRIV